MTTEQLHPRKPRSNRVWLWLLALPVLAVAGFVVLFVTLVLTLNKEIEKSPGYPLAMNTLTTHAGVVSLLGAPVRVVGTKAKHITKKPSSTTLELTFELKGSAGEAIAQVTASETGGPWVVERATIESSRGQFGLLADGELQPLYAPTESLASGP